MGKQLPIENKRSGFVSFIVSLVPTPKINTDGEFQLEFGVVEFLAEKAQDLIAKRKKKKAALKKTPKPPSAASKSESDGQSVPELNEKAEDAAKDEDKDEENGTEQVVTDNQADDAVKDAPKEAAKEDTKEDAMEGGDEKRKANAKKDANQDDQKNKRDVRNDQYSRRDGDQQLEESLECTLQTSRPDTTWDSVAGLQKAKMELQIAAELPEKQPALFTGMRKASRFILLYGPPGTGKGHLAKALCNSVDSTLFVVSASDMTSKWSGESERLVRLLFKRARSHKPAIIFFDEIDALCSIRNSDSSDHESRMKNEFLVQMDGLNDNNAGVLFVSATNLPWNIDPAFIRRFQKRIEVPLPDGDARARLFELEIGDTLCNLSPSDYIELAKGAEGFSGSDVKAVVQDALNCPITRVIRAAHFSKDAANNFSPCAPTSEGAIQMNWRDIPKNRIANLPVKREDFFEALKQSKPSVDPDGLEKYSEWTAKHGMSGA